MKVYLFEFYNYSQRIVYKLNNINEYKEKFNVYEEHSIRNFTFNDYINTEITINLLDSEFRPNYLILCDDLDNIKSRWYIINMSLKSGLKQHTLSLRRDIITDKIDKLYEMDNILINRGYCDINNPAFFNKENISVNEIPQQLDLLKDYTKSAWLVAYVANNNDNALKTVKFGNVKLSISKEFNNLSELDSLFKDKYAIKENTTLVIKTKDTAKNNTAYHRYILKTDYYSKINASYSEDSRILLNNNDIETIYSNIKSLINSAYNNITTSFFNKYHNKIIKVGNKYYILTLSYGNNIEIFLKNNSTIKQKLESLGCSFEEYTTSNDYRDNYAYIAYAYGLTYSIEEINNNTFEYSISTTRRKTNACYDIICSPLSGKYNRYSGENITIQENNVIELYRQLSTYWGSALYDVQILPFCPVPDLVDSNGLITMTSGNVGVLYDDITSLVNGITQFSSVLVCYVRDIDITFNIEKTIDIDITSKADYLTTKFKLISPNFSSEYELPVWENFGIDYFNVDMTLLPNSPWIKINPIYNYLNGKDLDDNKGLIISGSLSITTISNAWTEYVLQNSNYSQIFESQIAYQEYQNKMSLISSGIQSSVKSVGTGVMASLLNPIAGIASGVGSAIAGGIDLAVQNDMNNRQIAYQREQWNLQNGNIKAKPNTLSKITSINRNFKYFPYIVKYTCTDIEKEQVNKYLHLYGMNINQIGTIKDYNKENYYISCTLLDKDINFKLSSNEYENLKSELESGFYLLNYIDTVMEE